MIKTPEYWRGRSEKRLVSSEELGDSAIIQSLGIYEKALHNIEKEIQSIYSNYSKNGILQVAELKKALNPANKAEFIRKISKTAGLLNLDPAKIYDTRYLGRLTRLQALMEQIKLEVMAIAPQTEFISTQAYTEVLQTSYRAFQGDIRKLGITPTFSTLDKGAISTILTANWFGGNYSSRIWNNTGKLALELPTILGAGLSAGESYQKTARKLRERFDVTSYEATRLIRTETNYFQNQAELQSYWDDGIEKYEYEAILDSRTSKICRHLNGRIYYVKDAMAGVNYPPMHGNCRSTTTASFGDITIGELSDRIRARRLNKNWATSKERFQRFDDYNQDEIKERWKKAMQSQMNPQKATHDYNADMNILTQQLGGKVITQAQFQTQLDNLMASIPSDYPLRDALQNIAKLNGWKEPVLTAEDKVVNEVLKNANIQSNEVKLSELQKHFIAKSGLKMENARTGTDDIGGVYNAQTNTINLDVANLKNFSDTLGKPDFTNKVIQHELGHAVDNFAPQLRNDSPNFSESGDFKKIINPTGKQYSEEAWKVVQNRIADTIDAKDFARSIRGMDSTVFESLVSTGETLHIGKRTFKVPADLVKYHLQNDELFAESYALFHTNSTFLKKKAPNIFDFISEVSSKKL